MLNIKLDELKYQKYFDILYLWYFNYMFDILIRLIIYIFNIEY